MGTELASFQQADLHSWKRWAAIRVMSIASMPMA